MEYILPEDYIILSYKPLLISQWEIPPVENYKNLKNNFSYHPQIFWLLVFIYFL